MAHHSALSNAGVIVRAIFLLLILLVCHLLWPSPIFSEEDAVALFRKANLYASAGRYEEAVEGYNKVLKLDPQLVHAWNNKGNALAALCRHQEALECFNKALELASSLNRSGKLGEARLAELMDHLVGAVHVPETL